MLIVAALAFSGPGLGFLFRPAAFTAVIDVVARGPTGWSDVRTVFGGLELGVAALLVACAASSRRLEEGLVAALYALGGMIGGRLVSLIHDGSPGPLGWLLFAVESALFVATLVARSRLHSNRRDAD